MRKKTLLNLETTASDLRNGTYLNRQASHLQGRGGARKRKPQLEIKVFA